MKTSRLISIILIALVTIGLWNVPAPGGLDADAWHLVALYLGMLIGLITTPFPAPVVALIMVGLGAMFYDRDVLLAGYGSDMAWFICIVTIVCTAFIKTGLGKRIAYNLLMRAGKSTLGLGYMLVLTDLVLSPATGSNSSRTSIIYPIFQNIAEGTGSYPDREPRKLGAYLSILMYVSSQGTSALFLTGMATNAITASLAADMLGLDISWGTWFLASFVPIGLFLFSAPFVIYKVFPPTLKSLAEVKPIAEKGLAELGPITSKEKRLLVFFILAVLGWMLGPKVPFVDLSMQVVGFVFLALVLFFGVLDWNDVIAAKGAWNIFIWYGAFYGLATALSEAGFYTWLAERLGSVLNLGALNGMLVAVILVFISLAVRYFFVSNSAFVASFYPVLFSLLLTTQANPMMVAMLLAIMSPIGALLTHYGNGAGLISFAPGYVSQKDFWRVGTIMVLVGVVLLFVVGVPFWKLVGIV
ncbi:DASS family sodium-coupled anion symporter [Propionibacterium australiense]|uniref:DASS family sodium-coupled anion symporter n=1 Tax=Propionibacterium australiense TaxID=119981 RepID=A0A8B3FM00_9ACTN|nr:DASS family sodium-coupled anion symporter [Propionibacterium australiense]RLP11047.1 DASS family sodium-coupled anion symporter [Propionibacterium australiense]RLP12987.1 DASS family sodium-coupled anion symporter [Propionibacterium australiense]VEH91041.1 Inner membrane protein ybhI [Propionibacterium australiense]